MARGAQSRGWSYVGISDHSAAAFYASGLSREKVLAQIEEIDSLNADATYFRILKGIEADILADGRLDYGEEILAQFDYVIGSIHSRFGMDGPTMTERVLRALDDPFLTILAHPTGRLLLKRAPVRVDIDRLTTTAARLGVAMEINAQSARLDLSDAHARLARERGVRLVVSTDAHSVKALANMRWGVQMARRAWTTPDDVLNTRTLDDLRALLRRHRRSPP